MSLKGAFEPNILAKLSKGNNTGQLGVYRYIGSRDCFRDDKSVCIRKGVVVGLYHFICERLPTMTLHMLLYDTSPLNEISGIGPQHGAFLHVGCWLLPLTVVFDLPQLRRIRKMHLCQSHESGCLTGFCGSFLPYIPSCTQYQFGGCDSCSYVSAPRARGSCIDDPNVDACDEFSS